MAFKTPTPININKLKSKVYDVEQFNNSTSLLENFLLPVLEVDYNKFLKDYEDTIQTFLYWQDKIEEIRYRIKPHFTLSVVNNRGTQSIVAKVKWKYRYKGKIKKYPYLSVYIGSLNQYPKGLKDSQLFYDAPQKIQEYLDKECKFQY
jgi:hypothetical protein